MNLLSIDTSAKTFSLAVSKGEKVVRYRNIKLKRVLSSSIVPAIEDILKKSGMSLSKLDAFVVGLGPGSFTGLRVGLSTVKALAFASQKPIIGIPSLDVIAAGAMSCRPDNICTICDAKRGLVYCGFFSKNGRIKRQGDYLLTDIKDVISQIKREMYLVGDGVEVYRDIIKEKLGSKAVFADKKQYFPQAKNMVSLAGERFLRKDFDNINKLLPYYMYADDCQVNRKTKKVKRS